MRILAAEPEIEWLPFGNGLEKFLKTAVARPRRISLPTSRLEATGAPALAGKANPVTGLFEKIGKNLELLGKCAS
jgi:hypothetical protein